ncbi:hypothetical protein TRVL_06517 [Trypanosoma vivax]|nr:hypothetical protein TRVL_06517 [Trypanosoma vivax]
MAQRSSAVLAVVILLSVTNGEGQYSEEVQSLCKCKSPSGSGMFYKEVFNRSKGISCKLGAYVVQARVVFRTFKDLAEVARSWDYRSDPNALKVVEDSINAARETVTKIDMLTASTIPWAFRITSSDTIASDIREIEATYEACRRDAQVRSLSAQYDLSKPRLDGNPRFSKWKEMKNLWNRTRAEMEVTLAEVINLKHQLYKCQAVCLRHGGDVYNGYANYMAVVEKQFTGTLLELKSEGFIKRDKSNVSNTRATEALTELLEKEGKRRLGDMAESRKALLDDREKKLMLCALVNEVDKQYIVARGIDAGVSDLKKETNSTVRMYDEVVRLLETVERHYESVKTWLARVGAYCADARRIEQQLKGGVDGESDETREDMRAIGVVVLRCNDEMRIAEEAKVGVEKELSAAAEVVKSTRLVARGILEANKKTYETEAEVGRVVDELNKEKKVLDGRVSAVATAIKKSRDAMEKMREKFPIDVLELDSNNDDVECAVHSPKALPAKAVVKAFSDGSDAESFANVLKTLGSLDSKLAVLRNSVDQQREMAMKETSRAHGSMGTAQAAVDKARLAEMQAKSVARAASRAHMLVRTTMRNILDRRDEEGQLASCSPLYAQLLRRLFG